MSLPDVADIDVWIGAEIRAARLQTGTKQEDLAARLGIARTTLSRYEAGTRSVPIGTLLQIAYVLQTPLSELVPGARSMEDAWSAPPAPTVLAAIPGLDSIGQALQQRPDLTPQVLELISLLLEHDASSA